MDITSWSLKKLIIVCTVCVSAIAAASLTYQNERNKEEQEAMSKALSLLKEEILKIKNAKGAEALIDTWKNTPTRFSFGYGYITTWSLEWGWTNSPPDHFVHSQWIRDKKPHDCLLLELQVRPSSVWDKIPYRTNVVIVSGEEFQKMNEKYK